MPSTHSSRHVGNLLYNNTLYAYTICVVVYWIRYNVTWFYNVLLILIVVTLRCFLNAVIIVHFMPCCFTAPCGSGSCRNNPLRFLAGWRKRRLNQVLVSFGLVFVYVCSFYRLFSFFELTVFGCSLIQFC